MKHKFLTLAVLGISIFIIAFFIPNYQAFALTVNAGLPARIDSVTSSYNSNTNQVTINVSGHLSVANDTTLPCQVDVGGQGLYSYPTNSAISVVSPSGSLSITGVTLGTNLLPVNVTIVNPSIGSCSIAALASTFNGSQAFSAIGLSPGTYTATLTLHDDENGTASVTTSFTVTAPTASCSVSQTSPWSNNNPGITFFTNSSSNYCYVRNDDHPNGSNSTPGNFPAVPPQPVNLSSGTAGTYFPGIQAAGSHQGSIYCQTTPGTTITSPNSGWSYCPYTVSAPFNVTATASAGGTVTSPCVLNPDGTATCSNINPISTSYSTSSTVNFEPTTCSDNTGVFTDSSKSSYKTGHISGNCNFNFSFNLVVNGICSAAHYSCISGTSTGTTGDTSTLYHWNCNGSNGGISVSCTENKPAPTASLTASPISVPYNGQALLTWSSTNASSCTAYGPWSNLSSPLGPGSGWTNPLTADTTFQFQCSGNGQISAMQSVTVTVGAVLGVCSATHYSCNSGTSTGTTGDTSTLYHWGCNGSNGGANVSCTENKPLDGVCAAAHYSCSAGTSATNAENAITWNWNCNGSNGGTNALCSQPIPPPTNFTSTCPSPGTTAHLSWTLPVGYTLSYLRITDNTTGIYSGGIPEQWPDNGSPFNFTSIPGHNYTSWVHTRLPSGMYSSEIYSSFACVAAPVLLPDLIASAPTPTTVTATVPVSFSSNISNIGSVPTPLGVDNFFQVASSANGLGTLSDLNCLLSTGACHTPQLLDGVSKPINLSPFYTFASPGTSSVRACADKINSGSLGTIAESDETNNCSPWTNLIINSLPVPIVSISASPTSGTTGIVNPTITWSSTNTPTSCTATGDWNPNGAKSIVPGNHTLLQGVLSLAKTYTYILTCSNIGGTSAPVSATVTVTNAPITGTLTPASSSCTIAAGASSCPIYFTWTTTNPVVTSAVTSDTTNTGASVPGTIVFNGNNGTMAFTIPYPGRNFYLYNNAVLLAQRTSSSGPITAICISGTSWDSASGTCKTLTTYPILNDVSISSPLVIADGSTSYNITNTATDPGGAGKIYQQYALINYQGVNAGTYRGFPIWYYDTTYTGWDGLKDKLLCTGGGIAAINTGYGDSYIHLTDCNTSISGNTRTTIFTVRFNASFSTPVAGNDISGYVINSDVQFDGWRDNFVSNKFDLTIPPPTNFTSTCPSPGTTANLSWILPSGYTLSYFRIIDNTTGTYPPYWIPENVSDTGPATTVPTTPGHNYTSWVHTRLPSGAYSSKIYSSFACALQKKPLFKEN